MPLLRAIHILGMLWLLTLLMACRATTPVTEVPPTPTTVAAIPETELFARPRPTPRPPSFIKPPPAQLTAAGSTQIAGIASYCWREGDDGLCADYEGIATADEPLVIDSRSTVTLRLPITTPPTTVQWALQAVTEQDLLPFGSAGYRSWNVYPAEFSRALALQHTQTVDLELDPGLYVIRVSVWWEGIGDVMYGFFVHVEEG